MAVHALLLQNRLASQRSDLERLHSVLQSSNVPERDTIAGAFDRGVSPLLAELDETVASLHSGDWQATWARLAQIQRDAEPLLGQAQGFLGSVLLGEFGLDCGMAERAESLAREYGARMGVDWSPVVIFAQPVPADEDSGLEDRIVRLPVPRWDLWHLPLVAMNYGNWVLRHGQIEWERPDLVSDAMAAFTAGPAYAFALLFLCLDPASDLSRAATVLQVLEKTDADARPDAFTDGPYTSALRLLRETWQDAVDCAGNLQAFRDLEERMRPELLRLHAALAHHFGVQVRHTVERWQAAAQQVAPVILNGGTPKEDVPVDTLLNAAWVCRTRYADRISDIAAACERVLARRGDLPGLRSQPPNWSRPAGRLLHCRLYELEKDLERFRELVGSDKIDRADRECVAGRLYRMLSDQDYALKKLRKLAQNGAALGASLAQVIERSEGGPMSDLRGEVLDFLGGVLVRRQGLDQGVCAVAEALLCEFAVRTGVNWASRAVLGRNPLFSEPTGMIRLRFPDWDIWNLPLLAHEFGHVTALATPAFRDLLARELAVATQGHPDAANWTETERQAYSSERERHLHEFFADSFAVYCLGPAFVYDVGLLQFNPVAAHFPRGDHPTHAERMIVILRVLERMNQEEAVDAYDAGPYAAVLARMRDWWQEAMSAPSDEFRQTAQFLKLKATDLAGKIHDLLDRYYRLGAQYRAEEWSRAEAEASRLLQGDLDLTQRNLRELLNLGWAARVRYPDRAPDLARIVGNACASRAAQG